MKILKILFAVSFFSIFTYAIPLYNKCANCHGAHGEKKALNVSVIINKMNKKDFITALEGYKNGTYGKAMKNIMKVQVKTLTKKQIEELANYIVKK